ncbi:MAG: hypothetical protein ACODAJ_01770 [Planctomycetota bacterium]
MTRRMAWAWALLAAAALAQADATSRLHKEAAREHRRRQRHMTPERRLAYQTMRDVEQRHRRLTRREAEVAPEYRTEASLIYLDRERAAQRDPFELQRERDRRLAAERYKLDGLRYYTASDYRMGSETRRLARRRGVGGGRGYRDVLRRAERRSMDRAADLLWREEQRKQAIIQRVMAVANEMEEQAQAKEPQEPREPAWRRFFNFLLEPIVGE